VRLARRLALVVMMAAGCGGGTSAQGAPDCGACAPVDLMSDGGDAGVFDLASVDLASADLASGDLAAAAGYSTTFGATENPLSDGARWIDGQAAGGNLWGDVRTTPGLAFGVSEPTQYGDPTAVLTGTWNANQSAQATVKIVNGAVATGSCCHEAEVRLRNTVNPTTHTITGYEAYCSVMSSNAYCHIASWGGANGVWVNMDSSPPALYLKDGDVLKATATGSNPVTITLYINGTQVLQVQDTGSYTFSDGKKYGPWTSGNPGIGFYDNTDANWSYFGFSAFSAASL
jgi:hypothetical protein